MTRQADRPSTAPDALGWGEALLDASRSIGAQLGPEAAARFEAELFLFQRRRAFAYAIVAGALTLVFFVLDLIDAFDTDWSVPDALADLVDPILDGALALLYALTAVAIRHFARTREQVLAIFSTLLMVACSGMIVVVGLLWSQILESEPDSPEWAQLFVCGSTAIVVVFIMHFLASLFVALAPREALIPLVPITITYLVITWVVLEGPLGMRVALLCAWPLAGGPGVIWSTWRHRRFVERFRWLTLGGRYRDMRADMRDARRVHESLFPAPIDGGPVRLAFAYEPMRDIGGDYLFAHHRPDGGLLVVLFDVSGHGVASALAASRLHGEIDRLAHDRPDVGLEESMAALNRFVHRSLAPQAIFASAVGIEVACDGTVRFVSAGHPAALIRRASGAVDELASTTTLLGVLDASLFDPCGIVTRLELGDLLVACTDGVQEAADEAGEFFGDARFRAAIASARAGGASDVPDNLLREVQAFREGEATDDVLIAAIWRVAE